MRSIKKLYRIKRPSVGGEFDTTATSETIKRMKAAGLSDAEIKKMLDKSAKSKK